MREERGFKVIVKRWAAVVLLAATLLPFIYQMSGWIYLASALVLGVWFLVLALKLWQQDDEALARKTFRFSIWHLSLLFAALLVDHYLLPWQQGLAMMAG